MTRFWIALIVLLLCVTFCVTAYTMLNNRFEALDALLGEAEDAALTQDGDTVRQKTEELQTYWNEHHTLFAVLMTHSIFDSLDEYLSELPSLAETDDFDEFHRTCGLARHAVDHIQRAEQVNFANLF